MSPPTKSNTDRSQTAASAGVGALGGAAAAYALSEAAARERDVSGTLFWHFYDRGVGPGKYGVRSNDDAFRVVEKHARAMNAIADVPESCAVSNEA